MMNDTDELRKDLEELTKEQLVFLVTALVAGNHTHQWIVAKAIELAKTLQVKP